MLNRDEMEKLLQGMSLREKVAQVTQIGLDSFFADSTKPTGPMIAHRLTKEQMLNAGSLICSEGLDREQEEQIARMVEEGTRHKIPPLIMSDVIHGMRTIFPIPLGMGASFSEDATEEMARVGAEEASACGIHVTFAPMADVVRDPRWGRSMESFGEAPALCGRLSAAVVRGFHGKDESAEDGMATCVKHFAAYGLVQAGQDYCHVDVSRTEMYNTYLPPFREALDAGCDMLMPAFTPVDRIPATANPWLLRHVLRRQWGWNGAVITDWGSIDMMAVQEFTADLTEGARLSLENGVDMDMMSFAYISRLEELIEKGEVSEELLNESTRRILEVKNRLGLLDGRGSRVRTISPQQTRAYREKALQAALKSCVLMKNEGVLPLKNGVKLALTGSHADEHGLLGGWSAAGKNEETPSLRDVFQKESRVTLCRPEEADVILFACGEKQEETGEACSKAYPMLPDGQIEELLALSALGKPVVAVLFCGRALILSDMEPLCDAVLNAWFPGSEGAEAIRRLLMGDEVPSGHLPVTFPRCVGQIPIHHDMIPTGRPNRHDGNHYVSRYLDEESTPLYPFGFGLSYVPFSVSPVETDRKELRPGEVLRLSVAVSNQGDRAAETVLQLYHHARQGAQLNPARTLDDWRRVRVEAGETLTVSFLLPWEKLATLSPEGEPVLPRGVYDFAVGESAQAPWTAEVSMRS